MTNRKKIEALKRVQDYQFQITELLERIIKDTSDYYCSRVDSFTIDNKNIYVNYWWWCRGESGRNEKTIPIEWLDEGFDYKTAYREKLEREQAAERRKAAEEAKYFNNLFNQ